MSSTHFFRVMAAGALLLCLGASAQAQQPQTADMQTFFTFNAPVSVPGVTLPAGTYQFKRIETAHPDIVVILNEKGDTVYSIFMVRAARRLDTPGEPEIRFLETAQGVPHAIKAWWYPGDSTGYEFVYPKEQARLLMEGTGESLAMVEETPAAAPIAEAAEAPVEVAKAEPPLLEPSEPTAVGTSGVSEEAAPEPALPKTASAMPRVAFSGVVLLLGAGVAGALRLRRA